MHAHCLVRVLLYLHVRSRKTIMQARTQTMQQTHTHKAVAGRVEVKMLLSRREQSDYRAVVPSPSCLSLSLSSNFKLWSGLEICLFPGKLVNFPTIC